MLIKTVTLIESWLKTSWHDEIIATLRHEHNGNTKKKSWSFPNAVFMILCFCYISCEHHRHKKHNKEPMRAAEQRLFLKNGGVCQAVQECFKIPFPWNNILDCPAKLSLRLWYWPCAILAQSSWKIRPIHSFLLPLFPSVFSVDGAVVEEKKQLSQISYFLKSYSNLMPSCLCLHYRHAFFIKILLRSRLDFKILLKVKLNEI